jgi:hypothetical protein
MRLASSVLVVPRPSPGTEHHIQLTREGQGSEVITSSECHDHTWYDSAEKTPTPLFPLLPHGLREPKPLLA